MFVEHENVHNCKLASGSYTLSLSCVVQGTVRAFPVGENASDMDLLLCATGVKGELILHVCSFVKTAFECVCAGRGCSIFALLLNIIHIYV